ncbi:MAG: redoxin domain-containing protein [Candidatus Eisenbacteria bacterium]|nr:redoxin domain-containing protein [Candidatus Eisenbacteria bacterium]
MRGFIIALLLAGAMTPLSPIAVMGQAPQGAPPVPADLKPGVWKADPALAEILRAFEQLQNEQAVRAHVADVEKLLEKHPDWLDLHRHYISLSRMTNEWAKIEPTYRAKSAADPSNVDLLFLANLFERTPSAETVLRGILSKEPQHFHARCVLGIFLLSGPAPRVDEGFGLLFDAVRARPDHPYGYQTLAAAYEMMKDYESAIKVRRLSQLTEPGAFQPVQFEARDLEMAGRPEEALARIEAFAKEHPENRRARKTLIEIHKQQGRPEVALRAQLELAEMASDDPGEALNAAKALASSDVQQGLDWLKKAAQRGFDDHRLLMKDPEIAPLRENPEFAPILEKVTKEHGKRLPERREATLSHMISMPAPAFQVLTLDSATVRLADLKGKVVVLDFWATWCGPCRETLPMVRQIHDQMKDRPVQVLCMNVWEKDPGRSRVAPYWKENGYPMTVGLASMEDATGYAVQGIPTLFVLDQQGQIRFRHVGYTPYMDEEVSWVIEKLLREGDRGENLR